MMKSMMNNDERFQVILGTRKNNVEVVGALCNRQHSCLQWCVSSKNEPYVMGRSSVQTVVVGKFMYNIE